jgi:hypothetical protein
MGVNRILVSNSVATVLENAAIQGYEAPYKEERLGILLGSLQGGMAVVKYANVYRGGDRTRTVANVNASHFSRRVHELSRQHESQFLGTFHTHNETAGSITSALSVEDREHLCGDPPHMIELVVAIWRSDHLSRPGERYIQIDLDGYRLRIAGYEMYSPYRLIPDIRLFAD